MTHGNNNIQDVQNRIAEGLQAGKRRLGELLWWSTHGVDVLQADVERSVTEIVRELDLRDGKGKRVEASKVCPQLQARGAVRKALADLGVRSDSKRSSKAQDERVLFTRRLDASDDESLAAGDFSVVILEETYAPRPQGGVTPVHREVQRIRYDSTAKAIGLETSLLASEIHAGFRKYGLTYTANEVVRTIANLVELGHGFLAKASGGVYFVPASNVRAAQAVKALCDTIPGLDLVRWDVLDYEGGEQQVQTRDLAGVAIRRELAALQADLEDASKRRDDATLRASTIQRRIATVKTLKVRVQTYRDLLGLEDAKLKEQLNACLRAAKEIMQANVEAKAAAKVAQGNAHRAA